MPNTLVINAASLSCVYCSYLSKRTNSADCCTSTHSKRSQTTKAWRATEMSFKAFPRARKCHRLYLKLLRVFPCIVEAFGERRIVAIYWVEFKRNAVSAAAATISVQDNTTAVPLLLYSFLTRSYSAVCCSSWFANLWTSLGFPMLSTTIKHFFEHV